MPRIISIALALFLINSLTWASDAPASEASIREVLAVTEVKKLINSMGPQFEALMSTTMQQSLGSRELSASEQKIVDKMTAKMSALLKSELGWEKMEPLYLEIYREAFTQAEVDGMLAFYKSPAGIALIKKMPVVMQLSMTSMQKRMGPIMEKVQDAAREVVAEIEAEKHKQS